MWPVSVAGLQLANASGTSTVHTAFSGGMALQEVERTRVAAQAAERQLENPRPRRRVACCPSPPFRLISSAVERANSCYLDYRTVRQCVAIAYIYYIYI
jgi:hypothetical protein